MILILQLPLAYVTKQSSPLAFHVNFRDASALLNTFESLSSIYLFQVFPSIFLFTSLLRKAFTTNLCFQEDPEIKKTGCIELY